MTASLSASGLVPMSAAIAGSEVAMTVESMFSMNRATATISGTMRLAWHGGCRCGTAGRAGKPAGSRSVAANCPRCQRDAGGHCCRRAATSCSTSGRPYGFGRSTDDLHPGVLVPPLGLLLNGQPFSAIFNLILIVPCIILGLIFPVLFLVPSAARRDRECYMRARGPQAPRAGRGDRDGTAPPPPLGGRPGAARQRIVIR